MYDVQGECAAQIRYLEGGNPMSRLDEPKLLLVAYGVVHDVRNGRQSCRWQPLMYQERDWWQDSIDSQDDLIGQWRKWRTLCLEGDEMHSSNMRQPETGTVTFAATTKRSRIQ